MFSQRYGEIQMNSITMLVSRPTGAYLDDRPCVHFWAMVGFLQLYAVRHKVVFVVESFGNVPACIHILPHSWGAHRGLDHMTTTCF